MQLLKSLKHALLIQSALYKIVKNAFFTKSALIKIIKTCASYQSALYKIVKNAFFTKSALIKIIRNCASYSKRSVQNCQRTRSLLKVHLLKSFKYALVIESAQYKKVKNTFFTKSALIKMIKTCVSYSKRSV